MQVQQGRSLVKRFLLLVLLLDRAAVHGSLHPHAPLLFLPEASSKSSAQVSCLLTQGPAAAALCQCASCKL